MAVNSTPIETILKVLEDAEQNSRVWNGVKSIKYEYAPDAHSRTDFKDKLGTVTDANVTSLTKALRLAISELEWLRQDNSIDIKKRAEISARLTAIATALTSGGEGEP